MKIYFHLNIESFSNSYIVVNEFKNQAIIIDPCKINEEMINQLENNNLSLEAVFITHNHPDNTRGLKTLLKMRVFNITGFQQVRKTVLSEDIFGSGAPD